MEREVNMSIGCGVTDCKFNRSGDYCTLSKIHVGNTCDCDADEVLEWLEDHGGSCDCEVLANIEEQFDN